jgi:hypothetical protein
MLKIISKVALVLMLIGTGLSSCTYTDKGASEEAQGPEYTSTYVCPMHCEGSGSEEAGTCPTCGMDYVLNEQID